MSDETSLSPAVIRRSHTDSFSLDILNQVTDGPEPEDGQLFWKPSAVFHSLLGTDYGWNEPENLSELQDAVQKHALEDVRRLLDQGLDPNEGEPSPLAYAAHSGSIAMVDLLLGRGARVNDTTRLFTYHVDKNRPLSIAAKLGHTTVLQRLMSAEQPSQRDKRDALFAAVDAGQVNSVKLLVSDRSLVSMEDAYALNVLHHAVMTHDMPMVTYLLSNGTPVRSPQRQWTSPLHYAIMEGSLELVRLLIKEGSDINGLSDNGGLPMDFAVEYRHLDIMRALATKDWKPNFMSGNGETTLIHAIRVGTLDAVRLLLSRSAPANAKDLRDTPPLHHAAGRLDQAVEFVACLLHEGADVFAIDADGNTALHVSAAVGDVPTSALLMAKGLSPDTVGAEGETPCTIAASLGHGLVVDLFLGREEKDSGQVDSLSHRVYCQPISDGSPPQETDRSETMQESHEEAHITTSPVKREVSQSFRAPGNPPASPPRSPAPPSPLKRLYATGSGILSNIWSKTRICAGIVRAVFLQIPLISRLWINRWLSLSGAVVNRLRNSAIIFYKRIGDYFTPQLHAKMADLGVPLPLYSSVEDMMNERNRLLLESSETRDPRNRALIESKLAKLAFVGWYHPSLQSERDSLINDAIEFSERALGSTLLDEEPRVQMMRFVTVVYATYILSGMSVSTGTSTERTLQYAMSAVESFPIGHPVKPRFCALFLLLSFYFYASGQPIQENATSMLTMLEAFSIKGSLRDSGLSLDHLRFVAAVALKGNLEHGNLGDAAVLDRLLEILYEARRNMPNAQLEADIWQVELRRFSQTPRIPNLIKVRKAVLELFSGPSARGTALFALACEVEAASPKPYEPLMLAEFVSICEQCARLCMESIVSDEMVLGALARFAIQLAFPFNPNGISEAEGSLLHQLYLFDKNGSAGNNLYNMPVDDLIGNAYVFLESSREFGNPELVQLGIVYAQRALRFLRPNVNPQSWRSLFRVLPELWFLWAVESRKREDFDRAAELCRKGISLEDTMDPVRVEAIFLLSQVLSYRFRVFGEARDLDQAIRLGIKLHGAQSIPNHEMQVFLVANASDLLQRYKLLGKPRDLKKANGLIKRAIGLTVDKVSIPGLREYRRDRFFSEPNSETLGELVAITWDLLNDESAGMKDRFEASYDLAQIHAMDGRFDDADKLLQRAIIPLSEPINSDEPRRSVLGASTYWGSVSQLVGNVFLAVGRDPFQTLQAMETTKGYYSAKSIQRWLMTQTIQMARKPDVDKPESIFTSSSALSPMTLGRSPRTLWLGPQQSINAAVSDLTKRVADVGGADAGGGVSQSPAMPARSELLDMAGEGAIVVFALGHQKSDAILALGRGDRKEISHLELPRLRLDRVEAISRRFIGSTRLSTGRPEDGIARNKELLEILRWLWLEAVAPVLDALGFRDPRERPPRPSRDRPRVHWVLSGFMAVFPLHAAGIYGRGQSESAMDYIVSSYSASLGCMKFAGIREREQTDDAEMTAKCFIMGARPGSDELRRVDAEAKAFQSCYPQATVVEGPTRSQVLQDLGSCSFVHFACHGEFTEISADIEPALLIGQVDTLNRRDMQGMVNQRARLVYLSACLTAATSSLAMVDESYTLVNQFQLMGFPNVIGTLWDVGNVASMAIATRFYSNLVAFGPTNCNSSLIALSLHDAVAWYRGSAAENDVLGWAPFVHFGS